MKKIILAVGGLLFFFGSCTYQKEVTANDYSSSGAMASAPVSYQVFYDNLSPYGNWIDYPDYGYVWSPYNNDGFIPYCSNGSWIYSDYGWTWDSYYAWGWGPFHYGRWFSDPIYGWLWVPGYDWAPAWVIWGSYDPYYCWAPLSPAYSFDSDDYTSIHNWTFVQGNQIAHSDVSKVAVKIDKIDHSKMSVIKNTGKYNDQTFYNGPKSRDIERVTGTKLIPVTISGSARPVSTKVEKNKMEIYRPKISKSLSVYVKPEKVIRYNDNRATKAAAVKRNEPMKQNNIIEQKTVPATKNENNGMLKQDNKNVQVKPMLIEKKPYYKTESKQLYQNNPPAQNRFQYTKPTYSAPAKNYWNGYNNDRSGNFNYNNGGMNSERKHK